MPGRSACRTQPKPSRTVSGAAAEGNDGVDGEPATSCVRANPNSSVWEEAAGWDVDRAAPPPFSSSKTSSKVDSGAAADSTLAFARVSSGTSTVGWDQAAGRSSRAVGLEAGPPCNVADSSGLTSISSPSVSLSSSTYDSSSAGAASAGGGMGGSANDRADS